MLKFIFWSILNGDRIGDPSDSRILISRFIDCTSYVAIILFTGYVFTRFCKRIDLPFMQLMFEEKPIKPAQIRIGSIIGLTGLGVVNSLNGIASQTYLFDLMLNIRRSLS